MLRPTKSLQQIVKAMPALPYIFLSPKSPSVVLSERVVDHFSQNEQNIEIGEDGFPL